MSTDWRLLDEGAQRVLDLQGFGVWLQFHAEDGVVTPSTVARAHHENGTERSDFPWTGIRTFVREAHENGRTVRLVNEHQDEFDADGWARFSVYARTGHHKRKGYGPVE